MSTQSTLSFISQEEDGAPSFAPIVAPPEITWNNRRWVYLDHRPNRRRGAKISIAWELGDEYFDMNDPNSRAWRCQLCHPSNALISMHQGSTGAATRHLRLKHQRNTTMNNDTASIVTDSTNEIALTAPIEPPKSQLKQRIDIEGFRCHLLRWIVNEQLPFNTVENPEFQAMLASISQSVE